MMLIEQNFLTNLVVKTYILMNFYCLIATNYFEKL